MEIDIYGYRVLIDDDDAQRVLARKWCISSNGREHIYFSTAGGKKSVRIRLHRFIMGCILHDGKIVDHINGNTLDNRKCNLRFVTPTQSQWNQHCHKDSRTGLKGVTWDNQRNKWKASLRIARYKTKLIGHYANPIEAHEAYKLSALKYHGEYARTE